LDETIILDEDNSKLSALIKEAEPAIFDKFGFESSEKKYFIAGSARLYLYPGLIEVLNKLDDGFQTEPGDLDIVVPNKNDWGILYENLSKEGEVSDSNKKLLENYIYRPQLFGLTQMDIEAFDTWDPKRAGGDYKDVNVRKDAEILNNATQVNGYYYMSLYDVLDYKSQMSREKEMQIAKLIKKYIDGGYDQETLFKRITNIIKMRYGTN
jgi:hypothetical protein